MLNCNKLVIYLKNIIHISMNSKSRLILTLIGFSIGLIFFSTGNILIDSYYKNLMEETNRMRDTGILVNSGSLSIDFIEEFGIGIENLPVNTIISSNRIVLFSQEYERDKNCTVNATIIGTSASNDSTLYSTKDGMLIAEKMVLVKGRYINSDDIDNNRKVVVIDELVEKMMFGKINSIGKTIKLDDTLSEYEIVGVISNSFQGQLQEFELKKGLSRHMDKIIINSIIYCPISTVKENINIENGDNVYSFISNSGENKSLLYKKLRAIISSNNVKYSDLKISTKELLTEGVIDEYEQVKLLLNIILCILLIIVGISIMSIIFFSIKERIPEIGIRKTFGAGKLHIMSQFIIEGILLAIVAAVFSILVSILLSKWIEWYCINKLYVYFKISISYLNIVNPCIMSILCGIIFSLFPSIYAMRISVVESLRFE